MDIDKLAIDHLTNFLGHTEDKERVELYLSILDMKMTGNDVDLIITGDEDLLEPELYASKHACYIEWILFFLQVLNRLSEKKYPKPVPASVTTTLGEPTLAGGATPITLESKSILNKRTSGSNNFAISNVDPKKVIEAINFFGTSDPKFTYIQLGRKIIETLLESVEGGKLNDINTWKNITGYTFKNFVVNTIINNLIKLRTLTVTGILKDISTGSSTSNVIQIQDIRQTYSNGKLSTIISEIKTNNFIVDSLNQLITYFMLVTYSMGDDLEVNKFFNIYDKKLLFAFSYNRNLFSTVAVNVDNDMIKELMETYTAGFSYDKVGRHVAHVLLGKVVKSVSANDTYLSDFWSHQYEVEQKYFRDSSDKSKLYRIDKNGNMIDVTINSENIKKAKDENCYGIKVKETDTLKCKDLLSKCLSSDDTGKNIKDCQTFFKASDFWEVIKEEILEMKPIQFELILKSFGFKTETKKVAGVDYTFYESYATWLSRLNSDYKTYGLTESEYNNIKNNSKLGAYLSTLVSVFNNNLPILNDNYSNGTVVSNEPSYLNSIGVQTRYSTQSPQSINTLPSQILQTTRLMSDNIASLQQKFFYTFRLDNQGGLIVNNIPVTSNNGFFSVISPYAPTGMMIGGGQVVVNSINSYNSVKTDLKPQAKLVELLVKSLESKLSAIGKNIGVADKKALYDEITKFKEAETKLVTIVNVLTTYVDLLVSLRHVDKEQTLTIDHIKEFIKKRDSAFNKYNIRFNNINDLLIAFRNQMIDAQDQQATPVTSGLKI